MRSVFVLFVFFNSLNLFSAEKALVTSYPVEIYSKQQMFSWLRAELDKINPELELKLYSGQEWSDYVNYQHFVPLTLEGVPEGYVFNYNWDATLTKEERIKKIKMPSAEVTEQGQFIMWRDRCNFYEFNESECKRYIAMVVSHEAQHYAQWLRLSKRTIEKLGLAVTTPRTLDEIKKIEGAEQVFMSMWTDGAHYQCREVEVYSTQFLNGEMDITLPGRLKTLENYYQGCVVSEHRDEFGQFLQRSEKLFRENKHLLK